MGRIHGSVVVLNGALLWTADFDFGVSGSTPRNADWTPYFGISVNDTISNSSTSILSFIHKIYFFIAYLFFTIRIFAYPFLIRVFIGYCLRV